MHIWQHISEFKWVFFYSSICFVLNMVLGIIYGPDIVYIVSSKLRLMSDKTLMYTNVVEPVITYITLGFYYGLFFTYLFLLIGIYLYIRSGLYRYEDQYVFRLLMVSVLLLLVSIYISDIVYQFVSEYGLGLETGSIRLEARVSELMRLYMNLKLSFVLMGQLPIVLGVFSWKIERRWMYLVILFVSALITPPDAVSQLVMAIPICIMLEFSIFWVCLQQQK